MATNDHLVAFSVTLFILDTESNRQTTVPQLMAARRDLQIML